MTLETLLLVLVFGFVMGAFAGWLAFRAPGGYVANDVPP